MVLYVGPVQRRVEITRHQQIDVENTESTGPVKSRKDSGHGLGERKMDPAILLFGFRQRT
jgi:hypothetical protein